MHLESAFEYDCECLKEWHAPTLLQIQEKENPPWRNGRQGQKEEKVKEKVESEILDFVEASKKSPTFAEFTKDLTVPSDTRVKAIFEICSQAKFSDVTKNFLAMLAEKGRYIDSIVKKFVALTMEDKEVLKAIVTTVVDISLWN
ncbi:hypothetical protein GH714_003150 [Hevea brasiliensis]|uniref:Uncharacterized protein n=1 Tax=Hevea brasiliensis TaxID=3981 RepID=A0A6A6KYH8_HEVBR|nr:hypothetical protein GH714_003150 [Hevea brasiliensis]